MYDDDDQSLLDSPVYCDVTGTPYEQAYITLEYLPTTTTYSQQVPFNLNLTGSELGAGIPNKSVASSTEFWACRVVAAYQGETQEDFDPDDTVNDNPAYGYHRNSETCVVFLEPHRELPLYHSVGDIAAHEVGHTGGRADCTHLDCFMDPRGFQYPTHLCDACIHHFRSHTTWSSSN